MDYTSTTKLKQRLARMFRSSSSPCSSSTSASIFSSGPATSSRTFSTDTPHYIPGPRLPLLDLLSLPPDPSHPLLRHRPPTRFTLDCTRNSDATPDTKKEKRITDTGLFYEKRKVTTCPPASPHTVKNRKPTKKKLLTNSYGFTSSSPSDDDEFGFFSSEDREFGIDTLVRSFSSDSSEFYSTPKTRKRSNNNNKNNKNMKKNVGSGSRRCPPRRVAALCSGYRPVVCAKEAEVEVRSFAVVKRSKDPYEDFRTSMVEMIVERQKFGAGELEVLLQSYLSLNSSRHHPAIIKAFSDIWEVLFAN